MLIDRSIDRKHLLHFYIIYIFFFLWSLFIYLSRVHERLELLMHVLKKKKKEVNKKKEERWIRAGRRYLARTSDFHEGHYTVTSHDVTIRDQRRRSPLSQLSRKFSPFCRVSAAALWTVDHYFTHWTTITYPECYKTGPWNPDQLQIEEINMVEGVLKLDIQANTDQPTWKYFVLAQSVFTTKTNLQTIDVKSPLDAPTFFLASHL
jgi:hypothetical protein